MAKENHCIAEGCQALAVKRERCEKHYKAWLRSQAKCRANDCNHTLLPAERKTRGDYCRPHEQLALTRRSAAAQEKSLRRFREGIEPDWDLGCWLWKETPDEGYGKFHAGGVWLVHRFSYVWFFGGHERGKTLDHLCNRPLCARPDHMQPISDTINTKRRDDRAFAAEGTVWRHGLMQQDTTRMDEWAKANCVPYGLPSWLQALNGPTVSHEHVGNRLP